MKTDKTHHQIKHRTEPNIFSHSYILTKANFKAFTIFRNKLETGDALRILDLGCGYKPFKRLFQDSKINEYVGIDISADSAADIVGPIDQIAYPDNYFDGIIASQVFEHVLKLEASVIEMRRVAKNGALVYLSSPFVYQEHGIPHDYQRPVKYKYLDLFKDDEIISLEPSNCNLGTALYVFNACWALTPLKKIPLLTPLYYFFNNLLALISELIIKIIGRAGKIIFTGDKTNFKNRFSNWFYSLPAGYNLIIRIKK